jgi:hypothetical protein
MTYPSEAMLERYRRQDAARRGENLRLHLLKAAVNERLQAIDAYRYWIGGAVAIGCYKGHFFCIKISGMKWQGKLQKIYDNNGKVYLVDDEAAARKLFADVTPPAPPLAPR